MKVSEKELALQRTLFNVVAILGAIEAVAILYNGILCLETQTTVFDIEAHILIPLGMLTLLLRCSEAYYKTHHRKLCLVLYVALVLVSVVGFIATIVTNQGEDIIYAFGEMIALVGLVFYDVKTSKTIMSLY